MRIITWNIKGLTTPGKHRMLKCHLAKVSSNIVMLQETKCSSNDGDSLIGYCRGWSDIFQVADGRAGGLGILWRFSLVDIVKVYGRKNWQACQVKCKFNQLEMEL
ncbi:hypothetical protein SUGI_0112970 [Cryptomeria japonica]|nr:hypothetical protein SUGI_0112970 [Cryptomeria japonica]